MARSPASKFIRQYLLLASASLVSMFSGSQAMHTFLKPDLSLDVSRIVEDIDPEILKEITSSSSNIELKQALESRSQSA